MIDIGFSLTQASPWVQLPLVLLFALPAAVVAAAGLMRGVDWLAAVLGDSTQGDVELVFMANPEDLRREDQKLPKARRKYPRSRVTQALWVLIALVLIAGVVSML